MARDVAKRCWYPVLALVLNLSCLHAGERWSRQLTEFGGVPGNDWVPVAQPCPNCRPGDRQAGAKVLNYFDNTAFLGNDNSAQPQHHHLTFVNQPFPQPGQSSRVAFPPPPVAQPLQQEFESVFNQPFGSHQSFLQQSPFGAIQSVQRHPVPVYNSQSSVKDSLVQEKPSVVEQQSQFPFPLQQQTPANNLRQNQPAGGISQEEVQLLYVPVETLYNQKPGQQETGRFNGFPQPVSASLINDFYTAATTTPKPRTTSTVFTTKTTTKAPQVTKPKPNQPPLAMFMYNDDKQSKVTISDALGNLKNVNQIAVLDNLSKNLPKVFIGPSGLAPPKGYSKFELPYLSSIDQSRFERKLNDLPFFVAPLSYKTPNGFSKIPLPAPHVGSVIVQQAASSPVSNYYRQPDNIEYYQPSTLKFTEPTTKPPITLPASKPQYDSDHYTSPTSKPTTDRTNYSRGNTQIPQEVYRQPQTDRALYTHSPFNSVNNQPNRHIVNEEYFNLAKTKKPATQSSTPNYTPKTYKPFEFKPIPDLKIPLFGNAEEQPPIFTTPKPTTTTEQPHTTRQEEIRMKAHFKEENFRGRRPYTAPTVVPQYETEEITGPVGAGHEEEHFVHKFRLVDSVRPQTTQPPKSVIDNGFLDFFSQDNHDTLKTVVPGNGGGHQIVRNNYFTPNNNNNNEELPKQKFVSTYYVPTTTPSTTRTTTTTTVAPKTTLDNFFKDFEEKSNRFASDRPRFTQKQVQPVEQSYNTESFRYNDESYINKYRYETNTNSEPHYPVEVVTTQDPIRYDTTSEASYETTPSSNKSYNIPSELPPISANLPGLVNSLMEDEWSPQKNNNEQQTNVPASGTTPTKGHFRKTNYRTSTQPPPTGTQEPYYTEVTTRRSRGRRPTSSTTQSDSAAPTRSTTINRSRSRYVPSSEERSATRGRTRTRLNNSGSRVVKEEENLDYQRDVLKQNYPVIRTSNSQSTTTTSTAAPPPPPTTSSTTTTYATTMPLTYQQIYEEQTERVNLYPMTQTEHIPEVPNVEEVSIPKKESSTFTENYEADLTSPFIPTTIRQYERDQQNIQPDEESIRVLPVNHQPAVESHREAPAKSVEIQRDQYSAVYNTRRQPPVRTEEPATTTHLYQPDEDQEVRKVEITPRPRRPLSRQPVYSPRTTTERVTTERTTTEPSSRGGSSQRRPPFIRRPGRPTYTTTTAPTTTYSSRGTAGDDEPSSQGSITVRPKTRHDILRNRTRRPVTTTQTPATTASPEPSVTRGFARTKELRRVSPTIRSRQEQQQSEKQQTETQTTQTPRFRIRERTRFGLQPQESQWSTKLAYSTFQPIQNVESRSKNFGIREHHPIEPEPEIVTASPYRQAEEDVQYVNVSANLAGAPTAPSGVITNEVALSQLPPQAEDSSDDSNVPSFADLLNDVMKEYIDDRRQPQAGSKTVENEVVISDDNPRPVESLRKLNKERKPIHIRSGNGINFRKRSRSHAVDSFETAESQHINTHVFNRAGFEPLKNIEKAELRGKNLLDEAKGSGTPTTQESPSEDSQSAVEADLPETTLAPLPETTTSAFVETTSIPETTSILPTEREPTTQPPAIDTKFGDEEQASTEQFYDEEAEPAQELPTPITKDATNRGIFADVKKQLSDLFAMAETDPDTEELEDDERFSPSLTAPADHQQQYHGAERTSTVEPPTVDAITSTIAPELLLVPSQQPPDQEAAANDDDDNDDGVNDATEPPSPTSPVQVQVAMGPVPIPTSTSNGITHETEICYRGRCIKTDQKKLKKSKFKPN
ncbi:mucin-5AC [Sabethes cyaneus]|uniref:mucin-5AC n=1 Tax=Sabethes cyaneus TaxID=53552 RepID=UPI00237E85DE|nr:mucin-5AC [Sabethes cyaneus]